MKHFQLSPLVIAQAHQAKQQGKFFGVTETGQIVVTGTTISFHQLRLEFYGDQAALVQLEAHIREFLERDSAYQSHVITDESNAQV